jgi:coenzyme Q-binding protein COQ10
MPYYQEIRLVRFAPKRMFDIVADIETYPTYLPWCVGARINARRLEGDTEIQRAELMVGFRAFRERYTSEVTLDRKASTIDAVHVSGPFRHLISRWTFVPQNDGGTEIRFTIDFEFKNPVLRLVAHTAFGEAARRMVQAFEARAETLASADATAGREIGQAR